MPDAPVPVAEPLPDVLHELRLLVRSRYHLILLDTPEEDRAKGLLRHLAARLKDAAAMFARQGGAVVITGSELGAPRPCVCTSRRRVSLPPAEAGPARFVAALAKGTGGFSGAEIEQAVVSGPYTAFAAQTELSTKRLQDEAALTKPLSVTMAEKVAVLRTWAKGRTVAAG